MKSKSPLNSKKTNAYYDSFGRKYHNIRVKEGKLFNEYIEIPAVLELIKNVDSIKSILDVGCGSGIYAKKLYERGYSVEGVDTNEEMIAIAREYCEGLDIKFTHSPFEKYESPLKYDLVLGSFLLGYFEEPADLFSRMKHFLKPNGRIIVSGVHPIRTSSTSKVNGGYFVKDYFINPTYKTVLLPEEDPVDIINHTFQDISRAAYNCDLTVEQILEPVPQINPEDYKGYRDFTFHMRNPSVVVFMLKINNERKPQS